ncbi:TIGR01906 family membrane protein [Atopobacter sp. AH10]|uniref:TIGR01906 family membrane protein n=1 Tax=Atopobacter sp. AH10 TaxID=2315861 RepID=UPI000EF17DF7|nr:TIGR01906 family membrane protein [Atopobacter sp. AH10]RLK62774.1 TIGR01906 family membrane protein [Atopobacter sp. AH10]
MLTKTEVVIGMTFLVLALLAISVLAVLASTCLVYPIAIDYFGIDQLTGLSRGELIKNYSVLMAYLTRPWVNDLVMPYFRASREGLIHFAEVRRLLLFSQLVAISCLAFTGFWLKRLQGLGQLHHLKRWLLNTCAILLAFCGLIACDFSRAFILFHRLFFQNNYWIFDPRFDPVILALPQGFFAWCAGLAVFYLLGQLILLYIFSIYKEGQAL